MEQVIKVREMTPADVDSVVRVYAEVFDASYISFGELETGQAEALGKPSNQAPVIFRQELVDFLNDSQVGLFIASLGVEVIGFAVARLNQTKAGHTECWLDDLGTFPICRRRGVAQALVKHVLNWGTHKGAKYFLLETGVRNEAAHKLFEHLGFHPLALVFWHSGHSGLSPDT
jgi:ribosomal protein S18 acetylase RimI-like enzyme